MSIRSFLLEAMVYVGDSIKANGMISLDSAISKSLKINQYPVINLTAMGYLKQGVFIRAYRLFGPSVQVRS